MKIKVYKRHEEKFQYPEDMKRILEYLQQNGDVFVDDLIIENLYEQFSTEVYYAGWINLTDDILKEFEAWLNEREICI